MKKTKPFKGLKQAHTPNTQYGSGDYYGSGIKQKVGRIRDNYDITPVTAKKVGKPPKSLA